MRSLKGICICGGKFLGKWITRDEWDDDSYFCVGESKESIYLWCRWGNNGGMSNIHQYYKVDLYGDDICFRFGEPSEKDMCLGWECIDNFDFYINGDKIRWIK